MNDNHFCIIMAGGDGKRFWPLSRKNHPKQFIDLLGVGQTLLQITFNRYRQICPVENIYIVTNEIYKDIVFEQLADIDKSHVLLEPEAKNTAPCIAYASYTILAINPSALIIVAPADHVISNEPAFHKTMSSALNFALERNILLTLGMKANSPETNYGYIQLSSDSPTFEEGDFVIHKVKTFMEKPNLDLAKIFINSGEFLWNSGIFIWSVSSIMNAFKAYLPEVFLTFEDYKNDFAEGISAEKVMEIYDCCDSISIDNGVLENAENVYVLPADFGWTDIETWDSVFQNLNKDHDQNYVSNSNSKLFDTKNSIFISKNNKRIIAEGLEDYVVIEEDDVLLICKRNSERMFAHEVEQSLN